MSSIKYTFNVPSTSRSVIGMLIKDMHELCPKGVRAQWVEDRQKGTKTHATGTVRVTCTNRQEKKTYDAMKSIEKHFGVLVRESVVMSERITLTMPLKASRHLIGTIIREFRGLCLKGVKAQWVEDKEQSDKKVAVGTITVSGTRRNQYNVEDSAEAIDFRVEDLERLEKESNEAWKAKQAEKHEQAKLQRGTLAEFL